MAISTGTALALGGASLLSSLIGGIFGSSSQSSANQTNIKLARETNELNKQMFDRSLAFQEDMWNKTNAYNTPKHQVELLQQAGINPGAVFGNGSTIEASMPSVPSAPSMQSAQVSPVDYSWIPNSIDMGVNAFFNNQILDNQVSKGKFDAQLAKVDAEFAMQSFEYKMYKTINDSQASEYEKEQAKIALDVLNHTKQDSITQAQWSTQIMQKQYEQAIQAISESKLRQEGMRIANQYAPKMNEVQLKQYQANIKACLSAAAASDAQALDSAAHAAVNEVAAAAGRIDNNQKKIMFSTIREKAIEESRSVKLANQRAEAMANYGEARVRLVGNHKKVINTRLPGERYVEKAKSVYSKGVKQGISKSKH